MAHEARSSGAIRCSVRYGGPHRDGSRRRREHRRASWRSGRAGGSCFSSEEGAQFGNSCHQRGGEHNGGVLIHTDLYEALQVP
jgi:hypothetical protein